MQLMKSYLLSILTLFVVAGDCFAKTDAKEALVEKMIQFEERQDWVQASATAEELVRTSPSDSRAYNSLAGISGKLGKFEDEVKYARKAISLEPNNMKAHVNLGNGLAALGKTGEAKESFNKAAQLDPKNPLPPYSLGVLAETKNELEPAIGFYRKAIELDPKFSDGWYNLAAALANAKKFKEASTAIDKYLALKPNDPEARAMQKRIQKDVKSNQGKK